MTQTTAGTLWFATDRGLYWFDGMHFFRFKGTATQPLETDLISTVYAPPTGGLWMGFRLGGGVAFLKNGVLLVYPPDRKNLPEATVREIASDRDDTVWVATTAGISRYANGHWESARESWGLPEGDATRLLVDHAGSLWTQVANHLFVLPRGAHRFSERRIPYEGHPPPSGYITPGPGDQLWIAGWQTGLRPVADATVPAIDPKQKSPQDLTWPMMLDRQGAIWYVRFGALWRYTNPEAVARGASPHLEVFNVTGLAHTAPFEDREGNVWISTYIGPERLTPTSLHLVLGGNWMFAPVVATDGSLWWSQTGASPPTRVFRFSSDQPVAQLSLSDHITSTYRELDGTMWFAGRKALWHLEGGTLSSLPEPANTTHFDVQALARDGSGALWCSLQRAGVFRFAQGRWEHNGNLPGLPQETALAMATDARGRLWLGYTKGRLARVDGQAVQWFASNDELHIGTITALTSRGDHVWVGGEHGLARFDGTRFVPVPVRVPNDAAFGSLWGIVETTAGELWAAGTGGIVHLTREQLQEVTRGGALQSEAQILDVRDGLPSSPTALRPTPPVVEAGDGKLWFSFPDGLGYIDPAHLVRNTLPPPVLITGVTAAGQNYSPFDRHIRLPVGTTQLRITYTANTFAVPERVRFCYRLEGVDRGWQDVGNRREAVYTNVAPGTYRFRVIAANNDGIWNRTGAALSFTVLPAFYQTELFYVVCMIVAATLLYLLHRARRMTAAARARLEERITERARITRELHDTLLQGLQGLILRFQAVATRIPQHEPAWEMMESALTRADQVLIESRDRVQDIRYSAQASGDLSQLLAALGEDLSQMHSAQLSIEVNGTQRTLHPAAKDEVLMIAREALSNAFRHAGAAKIEVELEFTRFELRMRIRDDGQGIEPRMHESGVGSGHWGLRGMRERAKKIRARLRIWSGSGLGTEVELRVPASIAYEHRAPLFWWASKRASLTDGE
jgi:signal transduction histidine kinase/ligand-binding sensor domain-containing protein